VSFVSGEDVEIADLPLVTLSVHVARIILVLYYIRPQDWLPGLAGFNIMKPVTLVGLIALFNRDGGIDFRNWFRTPVDWAMLAYGAYIVFTSTTIIDTFKAFYPMIVYFLLTSQGIQTEGDLTKYLRLWAILLVVLAALAVGSLFGVDLTGARAATDAQQGRLALGTYMHNNPNALGHSVVAAIPLLYVFWFFKQSIVSRLVAVLVGWLVYYCIEQTESRGAFVVCAGGMLLTFSFGKPKVFQILMVSVALVGGGSVMALMPRAGGGLRGDEGVQGRMLAWEQARVAMQTNRFGVGYDKFLAYIRWREGRYVYVIPKATHGAYIKLGADLGYPGLFFYLLVVAACLRSAILPVRFIEGAGIRRARDALFLSLAMAAVSGWMIDRAYALEFFLLAGAFSAYHRILLEAEERQREKSRDGQVETADDAETVGVDFSSPVLPDSVMAAAVPSVVFGPDLQGRLVLPGQEDNRRSRPLWRRLGFIELGAAALFTVTAVYVWDRVLVSFLG
jgi:hypothetical protein